MNHQQVRKAKKALKRNRDSRPPRKSNWIDLVYDDADEIASANVYSERIMPRDENDRRRAVERVMYREAPAETPDEISHAGTQGLVTEVSAGLCRVDVDGRMVLCTLRGSLSEQETGYTHVVAVGDRVIVREEGQDQGVIEQILPRRNQLARRDTFYTHLQHVIAANIDQVLVIASWRDPMLWPELVDRYLIAAARNALTPVLCVNKVDLATPGDDIEAAVRPYRDLGYTVILTSAETGVGLDALRELLGGKISVLAGLSGVGKSTLLTAIQPDFALRVGAVSHESGQGRHTTTQSNMLPFGTDGYVIDTPGIREFGLGGLLRHELIVFYPELEALAQDCRFSNCAHIHEPECAVRSAAESGAVNATRYDSYTKIWASLAES